MWDLYGIHNKNNIGIVNEYMGRIDGMIFVVWPRLGFSMENTLAIFYGRLSLYIYTHIYIHRQWYIYIYIYIHALNMDDSTTALYCFPLEMYMGL